MKKHLSAALLFLLLCSATNLHAADVRYSGAYNGSLAASMMNTMADFMEWFLGQRNSGWRNPYYATLNNNPYTLYSRALGMTPSAPNPYRYRDYWDDPYNPWVDMRPLDGTWLAQSGEYWYVKGNRFVLLNRNEERTAGEFIVEGDFILVRLPWGEVEFEFRQMDDVLLLRDVNGRLMLLRRVGAGGWSW